MPQSARFDSGSIACRAIPRGCMEGRCKMARRHRGYRRKPIRILPLPEAVSGGKPWTVREAAKSETPHVDLGTYAMAIPIDETPESAWIRLHEMAHARWTPVNSGKTAAAEGIEPLTANACEDARIHRKLRDAEFPIGRALTPDDMAKLAEIFDRGMMEPLDSARLLMASIGTGDERGIAELISAIEGGRAIVDVTRDVWRQAFGKRRPAFGKTIEAGKALEDWFKTPPDPEVLESMEDPLGRLPDYDTGKRGAGETVWGAMNVETPPRPLSLPARIRRRTRRALPEGSFPRNWHRLPVDGAVFSRKAKRLPGGAVLIDQSGSMSLSAEDVLAIVSAAPAAIVATYAGDARTGTLRVLAMNGKRVNDADVHLEMGGNTVDGPALEWIGRFPGPRFWVSDGLAFGISGDSIRDAAKLAMKHDIRRVDTCADLIEAMADHR